MPAAAQEAMQVLQLTGAYEISTPNSWKVIQRVANGYFWETSNSRIRVRTYPSGFLAQQNLQDVGLPTVLEWLAVDVLNAREFSSQNLQTIELGSYSGYSYTTDVMEEGRSIEYAMYGYEFTDNAIVVGYIRPLAGQQLNSEDVTALVEALTTISRAERYTFYDGASFSLSEESWQIFWEYTDGLTWIGLVDEDQRNIVGIGYFPRYGVMAGFENPRDFLAFIWNANYQQYGNFRRDNVQDIRVAGFDAIIHSVESMTLNDWDMYGRAVIVFELTSNGSYVAVEIMTSERGVNFDPVYTLLDTFTPGNRIVCPLFASPGISIRAEATTGSERVRQTEDETLIAEYDFIGVDGYRWFFVGEGWIRSDVIFFENNTCEGIQRRR
jgi:hypothetical protein